MATITLARNAMATRFEMVLHGPNLVALRAAGEEALAEVERLEARLSLFQPASEIACVNARAAREPVRVTPEVFGLLRQARELWQLTGGAFDVTIGPLMRCWGFRDGTARIPRPELLAEARARTGMALVQLDEAEFTVGFAREGVAVDLGAIGKGYAVEKACEILREAGVTQGLVHGGTSTVGALGHPPDAPMWDIAIEGGAPTGQANPSLGRVHLQDNALSVSAVWGRSLVVDGRKFGHVLDPRTGEPTAGVMLAAVVLASATESDALSTALLVGGATGQERLHARRPDLRSLLVMETGRSAQVRQRGFSLEELVCPN